MKTIFYLREDFILFFLFFFFCGTKKHEVFDTVWNDRITTLLVWVKSWNILFCTNLQCVYHMIGGSRDELRRDVLLWTSTHGRAKAGRPAQTYIQQLCEDTGCCPEDLPWAMNDREAWRERVRDIRATSAMMMMMMIKAVQATVGTCYSW